MQNLCMCINVYLSMCIVYSNVCLSCFDLTRVDCVSAVIRQHAPDVHQAQFPKLLPDRAERAEPGRG